MVIRSNLDTGCHNKRLIVCIVYLYKPRRQYSDHGYCHCGHNVSKYRVAVLISPNYNESGC